ncbi:NAD(P)/FAD-dependent oxidoreductase [Acidisoma cellulosilytica]|uniref:NAD(P)/FAD-dependent oxidoreductase n=1 Tax=Acidisoma cellulosilyticum TaxID=2802395 RepID=A0A963Z094_9PROT|nr:NAD(P)/FAD-dependent oxidoreductase [Acidisoma cellulosilyticum]MCB8880462.1 NAD(P)/FAD-dependent oxidoreductase [Acidisoma cellulosilyticum]
MTTETKFDAIIIGAGAAGLMAAMTAGQSGKRVLLLDHNAEPGAKILISGGGRSNFTNREAPANRFISGNPHFAKSALSRYKPADFIALVDRHGIAWHEKTLGQLFCDGSAQQIVTMLMKGCRDGGVTFRFGTGIAAVTRQSLFHVKTESGELFKAPNLVIATGGLSIPKLGATGFAYRIAEQFDLPMVKPEPALVPLTFDAPDLPLMRGLSGTPCEVVATAGKARFREAMLFTHRGLSGPAILQISSYLRPGDSFTVDLLPGANAREALLATKRTRPRIALRTALAEHLPQRLAHALAPEEQAPPIGETSDKVLSALAERVQQWRLTPEGTEGFAKAEVTRGGIDTAALSSQTMEAKDVPGLHFIGEAVDVTGWLGGYNFQWAWASGFAAGQSV